MREAGYSSDKVERWQLLLAHAVIQWIPPSPHHCVSPERVVQMLVICHRGYHVSAPENTLEAFTAAAELGADGVETDVRLSADGIPLLFHDRLAPDGRKVSSLSLAELNENVGYPVPSLESAMLLSCKREKEILWDLEIKCPAALYPALEVVNRHKSARKIMITSFWHPLIAEASRLLDVELGVLVAHRPLNFTSFPEWMPDRPSVSTIVLDFETIDAPLVAQVRSCGLSSFVYGAMTDDELMILADGNVDGIITDNPGFLLRKPIPGICAMP